jgi:protein O-GlcNAc transferase
MATPDTLLAEARQALSHNRIDDAKALIKRALGRAPQRIDLLLARAYVEHASGDNLCAAETCRVVLTRDPRNVPALNALGEALRGHDNEGAEAAWRCALELDPRNAETLFHLGNLLGERNEADAAVAAYEKALQISPGTPSLLINLGLQLERSGKLNEAERCYRDVLVTRTTQIEALANLADLLFGQRRFVEALEQYDRLVERVPGVPAEVWNNRGVCQKYTWNDSGAIQSFQRALELEPESPQVLANLGFAEYEHGRYEVSRLLLEKAHKLDPTRLQIRAHLLDLDLQFADWNDFDRKRDELVDAVAAIGDRQRQTVAPFAFMSICDLPDLQLAAAKSFAWPEEPGDTAYQRRLTADPPGVPRLRLGFVSTVFHEHPVPRLIIDLLERLDRRKFEIYAYALGAGIADAMRVRMASLASAFREVAGRSARDIAAQIRADQIEILFDIAGHTEYARPDVFAARPAPLQVNYLGQAGTLGAEYYDYIGTDPYTTPPGEQANFAERFWYLGDCYFPCDPLRPIAEPLPSRKEYGLAVDAFVFLSQAAAFKLVPPIFDTWMRLLNQVGDSVLWLRPMLPLAKANLRAEAARRGIDPERLVFAPKEALPRYLARYRVADLYLDTHPFGSHTTVNDALFAGLPVLTLAGRSMAARASASQVRAVGLPELIATSHEEYESIALSLVHDPGKLRALTARLRNEARASPLFDMESYVRRFEAGLLQIWRDYAARTRTESAN